MTALENDPAYRLGLLIGAASSTHRRILSLAASAAADGEQARACRAVLADISEDLKTVLDAENAAAEAARNASAPDLHAQFRAMAIEARSPLPWRFSEHDSGLADASGVGMCMLGQTPSERRILAMILTAVNTYGGFMADAKEEDAQK